MSDALHCVTPNSIQKFCDTSTPLATIESSPSTTQHMYKKQKIGTRGSFPLRLKPYPVRLTDGLHPRFAHMHIGGLIQQNTLHKAPKQKQRAQTPGSLSL